MAKNSACKRLDLSTFTMQQLLEVDACTRCSACVSVCPVREASGDNALAPIEKIQSIKGIINNGYGLKARLFGAEALNSADVACFSDANYRCLLCNRCAEVCPAKIDTRSLWVSLREAAVKEGVYPEALNTMAKTISDAHNITGDDAEMRLGWQEDLLEDTELTAEEINYRAGAKVAYLTGCVSSLYATAYGIPQSVIKVLTAAGVDVTTFGDKENCCGFPLMSAGMLDKAREIAVQNVQRVREFAPTLLVTSCPSCYHTWHHSYPQILGEDLGIQVVHTTQFVDMLLKEGHLQPKGFDKVVTYHDPCDLGRNSKIYEAPRNILKAIPGLEFTEMPENRDMALCCGGGGNLEMADEELGTKVSLKRIQMAQETGATVLASACQQCKRKLSTTAKKNKLKIKVLDVLEILAAALEE